MSIPTTRQTFIDYCLRKLGYPVIEINIAPDQLDDRVDEALQLFQLFHMDSVERVFIAHTVTQNDLDAGYLTLVDQVLSVTKAIFPGSGFGTANFATNIWQYQYDVFYELGFSSSGVSTGLSDYIVRMSNLRMIEGIIANHPTVHHSMHSNKLFIDDDWANINVDDIIMYEAYMAIDPDEHISVWNDIWLKDYATSLIGRQWASNLQKFQEVQLPGGITLNGDNLYTQFQDRITKLEEELDLKYSYPVDFFVG